MGSVGCECCDDVCPTPPVLSLVGMTQTTAWQELPDCCWYATYDYDIPLNGLRYTGPLYSSREFEYKGRVTYSGSIGTRSYGECVDPTEQDVGYMERWAYGSDQWRKFAVYGVGTRVRVYTHRVAVIEGGLTVYYWYYRIEQDYAGSRGWERKQMAYDATIYVSTSCTLWLGNSNNVLQSSYPPGPNPPSWVETLFINFACTSVTYFQVRESDLDPIDLLEVMASSEDDNLPTASTCTPGIQSPCSIAYNISPPNACSTTNLSIFNLNNPITCNIQIRQGTSNLFLDGQRVGMYSYNFNTVLMLINNCCIEPASTCSWQQGFWWWRHEPRIDINNCETIFNPYDLVFHGIFQARLRLP
jgi:hypothetical protein